jgi:hypothetical protein
MSIDDLFFAIEQVPFYTIPLGEWFQIDLYPDDYSDTLQKTTEADDNGSLYVGHSVYYLITPKSLVTYQGIDKYGSKKAQGSKL